MLLVLLFVVCFLLAFHKLICFPDLRHCAVTLCPGR